MMQFVSCLKALYLAFQVKIPWYKIEVIFIDLNIFKDHTGDRIVKFFIIFTMVQIYSLSILKNVTLFFW